jgi:hypothetical protein
VHAQLDLTNWQEAVFQGEEGVLLVGMDHLARLRRSLAMLALRGGGAIKLTEEREGFWKVVRNF